MKSSPKEGSRGEVSGATTAIVEVGSARPPSKGAGAGNIRHRSGYGYRQREQGRG